MSKQRVDLTAEAFMAAVQGQTLTLCPNIIEAHKLEGVPRVCYTGLLPDKKTGATAWVWDDGLCLVSEHLFALLGGTVG